MRQGKNWFSVFFYAILIFCIFYLNFRKCIINTFSIDYHLWKASPRSTLSLARARRRRISITAGWAAEGSEACGSKNDGKIVLALDFVACQSKKRANILNICTVCLCSPSLNDNRDNRDNFFCVMNFSNSLEKLVAQSLNNILSLLSLLSFKTTQRSGLWRLNCCLKGSWKLCERNR